MIGQTAQIAPADKKLYALRDVTGDGREHPAHHRVDHEQEDRRRHRRARSRREVRQRGVHEDGGRLAQLAESLVSIGTANGVRTEAIITRMDAPLGRAVGNALEVIECLEVLKGRGPADLIDVSVELTARMLVLGKVAADAADAVRRVREAIASGAGLERFRQIIESQGGDPRVVEDDRLLPHVAERHLVTAARAGYVTRLDAELVGRASVALGAGRDRVEDPVDHAVGVMVLAAPGDQVGAGDPILELHYRDRGRLDPARQLAGQAITISDQPLAARPLIVGEVR